jgi:hypothetical protein
MREKDFNFTKQLSPNYMVSDCCSCPFVEYWPYGDVARNICYGIGLICTKKHRAIGIDYRYANIMFWCPLPNAK